MEGLFEAKKLIEQAQNILVLTPKNPGVDNLGSALSLSYTLNNVGKIVNFFPKRIPQAYLPIFPKRAVPESFVISIQGKEISELYYEKENQILRIFLTSRDNEIKKEDVRLVSSEETAVQDSELLITIGLERLERLGDFYEKNFKLFYQTPILNIDNQPLNNKFGNVNLISESLPVAVIVNKLISAFSGKKENKNIKAWLLAGIMEFSQTQAVNQEVKDAIFELKDASLSYEQLIDFFAETQNSSQTKLLAVVLRKMELNKEKNLPLVCLKKEDFKNSNTTSKDLRVVLENLTKNIFQLSSLLLLWESDMVLTPVRGVFYSNDRGLNNKIAENFEGQTKKRAVLFGLNESNIDKAKNVLIETI